MLGSVHPQVALSLKNLAEVHLARGDPDAALPLLRGALQVEEATDAPAHTIAQTRALLAKAKL